MSDETFENLEVWREGMELSVRVYELTRRCRDFDFRSQIRRAALSISSNIAGIRIRSSFDTSSLQKALAVKFGRRPFLRNA